MIWNGKDFRGKEPQKRFVLSQLKVITPKKGKDTYKESAHESLG